MRRSWINGLVPVLLVAAVTQGVADATPRPSTAPAVAPGGRPQPDDLEAASVTPDAGDRDALLGKPATAASDEPSTWLIRLADPAVPSYDGGRPGLAPTAPRQGQALDP